MVIQVIPNCTATAEDAMNVAERGHLVQQPAVLYIRTLGKVCAEVANVLKKMTTNLPSALRVTENLVPYAAVIVIADIHRSLNCIVTAVNVVNVQVTEQHAEQLEELNIKLQRQVFATAVNA